MLQTSSLLSVARLSSTSLFTSRHFVTFQLQQRSLSTVRKQAASLVSLRFSSSSARFPSYFSLPSRSSWLFSNNSPHSFSSSRYFQTRNTPSEQGSPSPSPLFSALVLLGNAGKDLSLPELQAKLLRVVSAGGVFVNETEISDFLNEEHRIVKCTEEQLVKVALQLCIQGGEEQPSSAQVQRVFEAAGVEMDPVRLRELVSSVSVADNTPLLEGSEGQLVPAPKSRWGTVGAIATGAAVLAGKTKYVLVALKLTKMTPLISMMVTSFAYSFVFGWPYAIGMVGQMLLHESGHAAVMRYYGIPFSPMVFIPFMGAAVSMKDAPRNAYEEAMIAFGGPVIGTAAAASLAVIGAVWGSPMLVALADFGLMINLFNLLPIGSLDGGRIASALSPWLNVVGLMGGGLLLYTGSMSNPIFYLIMLAGTYTTVMRFVNPPLPAYTTLLPVQRLQVGLGYLGLVFFLLWAMRENNRRKLTPKQVQAVREGRMRTPPLSDPEAFYTDESWDLSVPNDTNDSSRWR